MPPYTPSIVPPDGTVALQAIGPNARAATFNLCFDATHTDTVCALDVLPPSQQLGALGSIFLDNTANAWPLTISFPDTGAADTLPGGASGWFLAITGGSRFGLHTAALADAPVLVQVLNVVVPPTGVQAISGAITLTAPSVVSISGAVALGAGAAAIGSVSVSNLVGGFTPRVTATQTRPADGTAYTIGDLIGNSGTAASVVPLTFTVARAAGGSGRISGARAVVTAASGTIVLPAFDLLLFRPESGIPFPAAGYPADNAVLTVGAPSLAELVGVLSFGSSGWRNATGGAIASGNAIYQAAAFSRPYAPFNLLSTGGTALLGLLQAQSAWAPGAVANQFDFALDVDQD
jgi:hypothetical protein